MMRKHMWIRLSVGGLIIASMTACGPAPSSPSASPGATPQPDTIVVMPTVSAPTGIPVVQPPLRLTSTPLWTVVPITRTRAGGREEKPILSGVPIPTPPDFQLQQNVTLAKEDLAQRLGVSVDSITVGAVIGQEFSTDAFNCRTSKERIAKEESPSVVSGQTILLSASGRRYEYHASGQTVIFCRPLP